MYLNVNNSNKMTKHEVLEIITETIRSTQMADFGNDGNNWVNIAQLGTLLREKGIDFTQFGFPKFKEFLSSFCPELEVKNFIPKGKKASVSYVRIVELPKLSNNNELKSELPNRANSTALFEWAYLKDFEKLLSKLSSISLEEEWDFHTLSSMQHFSILRNYLIYTFERLKFEDKVIISSNKRYAVFNTGLVNKLYSPIFALFVRNNMPGKQPWYFVDFAVEGEDRAGKTLVTEFRELPQPAEYFTNVTDVYYDVRMGCPILDTTHILIERAARLPIRFLQMFGSASFDFRDSQLLSNEERIKYEDELKATLMSDVDAIRRMQNRLDSAVSLAIKRVRWNYKSAIPMYYPRLQKMQLLLPLCLVDDQIVDTALVVSKEPSGRYQGQTIYPLDWAYKYARLVCRPDSDWLTVELITPTIDDTEQ